MKEILIITKLTVRESTSTLSSITSTADSGRTMSHPATENRSSPTVHTTREISKRELKRDMGTMSASRESMRGILKEAIFMDRAHLPTPITESTRADGPMDSFQAMASSPGLTETGTKENTSMG